MSWHIRPIESQHNHLWSWAHYFGFSGDERILAWVIAESVERLVTMGREQKALITIGDDEDWVERREIFERVQLQAVSMSELLILDIKSSLRNLYQKPNTISFKDFFCDYPLMDFRSKYAFWTQLYKGNQQWFTKEWWDTKEYLLKTGYEYFARMELDTFMKTLSPKYSWCSDPWHRGTSSVSHWDNEIGIPQPVWARTMPQLFD